MFAKRALFAGLVVAGAAMSASAALITSYESQSGGPSGATYVTTGAPGVTNGSYAAKYTTAGVSGNSYNTYTTIYSAGSVWTTLKSNPLVSLDVFVAPDSTWKWCQVKLAIQGAAPVNMYDTAPWTDASPGDTGKSLTLNYDFSTFIAAHASDTTSWFNVILITQGGKNHTFTIDNLRANPVPEPAALGLVGVASLGLLHRRKHQA